MSDTGTADRVSAGACAHRETTTTEHAASDPGLVCVGVIGGTFGTAGQVRVRSFCVQPEDIMGYSPLLTEDGKCLTLTRTGTVKGGFSVRLENVSTREQAAAMKGVRLYIQKNRLPKLGEDEYYHADLVGMEVVDTAGKILGNVKSVQNHGASDILEVRKNPDLSDTVLLPFTASVIPSVDIKARRIIADPPPGLS